MKNNINTDPIIISDRNAAHLSAVNSVFSTTLIFFVECILEEIYLNNWFQQSTISIRIRLNTIDINKLTAQNNKEAYPIIDNLLKNVDHWPPSRLIE